MMMHYYIFSVLFGLVLGSFMNVLIYRVPRNLSIATPGSSCPKCGKAIRWYCNIPLLSYLFQRGRCVDCGAPISWQYPFVEFMTALIFLCITIRYGADILTVKYCIFAFLILAGAFTDMFTAFDDSFECGVLPHYCTIGGAALGYIFAFWTEPGLIDSFAGSGIGAFSLYIPAYIYYLIRGREGMGDGDPLFMAMAGSFLGVSSIIYLFTVSALFGVFLGLIAVVVKKNREVKIPYAVMIGIASILYLFTGNFI
ncbi:MAG: prepilin peptidase [Deferribacteraceae bacterium]|jgi:leader peptidase (prepilin peptidase)/N-methyltransferase|nr:prepilin peptidase [Deferribacteraceae bacterium]